MLGASTTSGLSHGPRGPLELIDRAFSLVRATGFGELAQAWLASLPLMAAVLALYDLERVENVHSVRGPLALVLALGLAYRALVLGRLARRYVHELRPGLPIPEDAGRTANVLTTAAISGMGLWVWLWPLGVAAKVSVFAVAALFPLVSARGAVAPSWLARASCASERGFVAFGHAVDDNAGVRGMMASAELVVLIGTLVLFANLYALTSLALMVGSSMLGLETGFVSAFLSPDNEVVPLVIASLTLILLEPLRAALSACAFVDARSRRDGADLHAAIDTLISKVSRRDLGSVVLVVSCLLAGGGLAHADDASQHDRQARQRVERILAQPEFGEVTGAETQPFWRWLTKLIEEWLDENKDKEPEKKPDAPWHLDLPAISPWAVMVVALGALAILVWRMEQERKRKGDVPRALTGVAGLHPTEAEPRELLDDAAALAARAQYREALRSLYIATLAALDRARLIRFEPAKTNGQYLRAMPPSEIRKLFAAFTNVFDHKWYGREPADQSDYERCRALADRICTFEELP